MITELEQNFYDTFGIEPECHNPIVYLSEDKKCKGMCQDCEQYRYSVITAKKLLQMICIVFNTFQSFEINRIYTVETLKDKILSLLILAQDDVYNQIQQIFKD